MFEEMLRKYTVNYQHKLKKLIKPLEDNLQIKHFCYYSIKNDGQHHFLGTNVPFLEYFYDKKLYVNCPYLLHPSNYQSGISLSKSISESEFQESQDEVSKTFHMNIALTLIEKNNEGIEGFCFATDPRLPYLDTLVINELPVFKHFTRIFKEECSPIINKLNNDTINLKLIKGHPFATKKMDVVAKVKDRDALLKKMGISLPIHLTENEKEIAKMVAYGYTAKEIGLLLNRSRRTIESYIEVLKESFFCTSKSELILKTQELAALGYFQ